MIEITFDECCKNCPHIEVMSDTVTSVAGSSHTVIYCEHAKVCGEYRGMKKEE